MMVRVEELTEVYKRIGYLRNKGVKMKDMADYVGMTASVLSSLYSSVLPTYIGCMRKGMDPEEALDYALSSEQLVEETFAGHRWRAA